MPFGARRFTQLVYAVEDGASFYRARFVPLDFGAADELLTEDELTRAINANLQSARPLGDLEEKLALAAFRAQQRGKTFTRAAVESVAARGAQRATVDVLDATERATVEKFRLRVERAKLVPANNQPTDPTQSSRHDFLDAARDTLALLDKYLPKPKPTPERT